MPTAHMKYMEPPVLLSVISFIIICILLYYQMPGLKLVQQLRVEN